MPARQVLFVPNGYYHIYNRGSEKRTLFLSEKDYQNFLKRLQENAVKHSVDILVYCLMPNHFHLLVHQQKIGSIRACLSAIQLGYAKYFNTKYHRVGPLFQGRFKAKMIEKDEYLLQLSAYIHRNPLSLSSWKHPKEIRNILVSYPYSSYHAYLKHTLLFVKTKTILAYFSKTNPKLSYQAFVEKFIPDIEALSPWINDEE